MLMLSGIVPCKAADVPPSISVIVDNIENLENKIFSRNRIYVNYASIIAENKLSSKPDEKFNSVIYSNIKDNNKWGVHAILAKPIDNNTGETVYFAKNGKIFEWINHSNHAVIAPFEFGRNMYSNWTFFLNIGITPFRRIAETNGVSFDKVLEAVDKESYLEELDNFILPDSIKNNMQKYTVNPIQDEIDGHKCWVVEWKNADKIWFDSKLPGIIRKRIIHWKKGQGVKSIIKNSNFKEFNDGIILPELQEVTHYVGEEMELDKSLLGKEHSHFVYQVNLVQFDAFDQEAQQLSNYSLSPGTSIFDVSNNYEYTITKPNSDPFTRPAEQEIKINRYAIYRAILIIAGSILALIGLWLILRKEKS
jgi:hypothetical protein